MAKKPATTGQQARTGGRSSKRPAAVTIAGPGASPAVLPGSLGPGPGGLGPGSLGTGLGTGLGALGGATAPGPTQPTGAVRAAVLGRPKPFDGPPSEFPEVSDPKKRAYLAQLAQTGKFDDAAMAAGVTLRTGWNWRHNDHDPEFAAAVEVARGLACDRIEQEIARRALEGVEEPVFQGGRMVGTIRRFSDVLLIFLAKAAMPKKYRERVEHTGADGGPIAVQKHDVSTLSVEELRQLKGLLAKTTKGGV